MEKYFIVFVLDFNSPNGKLLSNRYEINDNKQHIRGFITKASMKAFVEEYKDAFLTVVMLKPIS